MSDETARNRFMVINAVRVSGVIMVAVGMLINAGVVAAPDIAAYVLIAVGVIDVFVVPQVLARRWRTPPDVDGDIGSGVGPRSGSE